MRVKKRSDLDLDGLEEEQADPQGLRGAESNDDSHDDENGFRADWGRASDTSAASSEPDGEPDDELGPGAAVDSTVSADSGDAAAGSVPPGAAGSAGADLRARLSRPLNQTEGRLLIKNRKRKKETQF